GWLFASTSLEARYISKLLIEIGEMRAKATAIGSVPAAAGKCPGARRQPLSPRPPEPQLASIATSPPAGERWIHEIKWDGYRMLATVREGRARVWSRNGVEWTDRLPRIAAALEQLEVDTVVVDGELIADGGTQADFNVLLTRLSSGAGSSLQFVLFDILYLDGYDVTQVAQLQRKQLLAVLMQAPIPGLSYSAHVPVDGDVAFKLAASKGYEGIVSKRAESPYTPGRGDAWVKVKAVHTDEYAVVGYTPSKGASKGVGALLLATPGTDGKWTYRGRAGTGLTDRQRRDLAKRFVGEGSGHPTVAVPPKKLGELGGAVWYRPLFVVEAMDRGKTRSGVLRQPSIKVVRVDRSPADLVAEAGGIR
ncbi:MAG: non-homologous end-joining DNA ligase, partial [Pseudomonas sp.]